jgi:hypothetical protein
MEIATQLIQALGFPIFVCLWLMYRVEKRLEKQHAEQHRTNVLLAVVVKVLDGETSVPENVVDEVSGVVSVPLELPTGEDE